VGSAQKSNAFWGKIADNVHKVMAKTAKRSQGSVKFVQRSHCSLQSKWDVVSRECNKFSGALSHNLEMNESGKSFEDQVEDAKAHY
jgi:hypothetical protein